MFILCRNAEGGNRSKEILVFGGAFPRRAGLVRGDGREASHRISRPSSPKTGLCGAWLPARGPVSGEILLEIIMRRYENRSTMMTSKLVDGFTCSRQSQEFSRLKASHPAVNRRVAVLALMLSFKMWERNLLSYGRLLELFSAVASAPLAFIEQS
jgi:hypothetical protein